jgi:hypothetical protein
VPAATFIQNSRAGRAIFEISRDEVHVSSWMLGRRSALRVCLRELSPNYVPGSVRIYAILYGSLAGVLVCSAALWLLYHTEAVPEGPQGFLAHWPLIGLAASLVNAIRFTPRVEFFTFLNQWGRPAFSIVREKRQAAECDAFILTLVAAIELAHSEMPEADRKAALRPLLDELQSSAVVSGDIPKWQLSLATGLAAVLLPILPGVAASWGDLLFLTEFPLCVVAMAFGILALWNREPRRWWGLLGVAHGLVPLFFY